LEWKTVVENERRPLGDPMFCQQCGAVVQEGQTFCDDCSRKIFAQQSQGAPGDVFAAQPPVTPPGQVTQYLEGHSTGLTYGAAAGQLTATRRSDNARLVLGLTIGAMTSGLIVLLSTFLAWVSSAGYEFVVGVNPTGWTFLTRGGSSGGNFAWIRAEGILYFSGLWSILAGLGIIAGAVMLLLGYKQGGRVAGIAAVVGAGTAMLNLVMTLKLENGIGIGIWLFLLFSIVAVVCGEFATRKST
jgi:hypothetical protein